MADRCVDMEIMGSAALDGALDDDEHARLDAHLARCADCRAELDSLARTRAAVRSAPVRRAPPGLLDQPVPPPAAPAPARATRGPAATVVAVVLVGLVGGAAFALGHDASETGTRTVDVPVDVYVADHLVRTVDGPVTPPVLVDARP